MATKGNKYRFLKVKRIFQIDEIGYTLDRFFDADFADHTGEQHSFVEMVYVVSGKIEIVEDENVYVMTDGDMLIHAPMELHRMKMLDGTRSHILNLSIDISGELPSKLYDGVYHLMLEQREKYINIFKSAEKIMLNDVDDENTSCYEDDKKYANTLRANEKVIVSKASEAGKCQQAADMISAFLMDLYYNAPLYEKQRKSGSAQIYKVLVKDMQENVCENITIYKLAEKNHVSVSYVKKLFNSYLNMSPKTFYDLLRVKEAKKLLQSDMPVMDVSEKMNFSSSNHFSTFFKKHTGFSPATFKRIGVNK